MNKNFLMPLAIIIVSVTIGGIVLFSGKNLSTDEQLIKSNTGIKLVREQLITKSKDLKQLTEAQLATESNNLRKLELSVPNMSCAGCTSSVEGYVSSIEGVKRVQARLTPIKSATIVYDPSIVTKEEIMKNQVFDLYGVSIIFDEPFVAKISLTRIRQNQK